MEKIIFNKGRKGQIGRYPKYDVTYKRYIVKQYKDGDRSMAQVAVQNGLTKDQVKEWVKQFSSEIAATKQIVLPMTEQEKQDFELLRKRTEALEKKLQYEQMKNFALETMIDLAKEELGVDIRKNSGAKQPKE
jgi:transposase